MGADASATILYGFPFCGDDFGFDSDDYSMDPDKWLAEFQDLPEPDGDYKTNEKEWSEYWEKKRTLPVYTQCEGCMTSGVTTTYLCIKESILDGCWEKGTKIPLNCIKPPPAEWNTLLRDFCEKSGVPFEQPDWYLTVRYG